MASTLNQVAIEMTQETLAANAQLQEQLVKHIQELESEHEQLDKLINSLSKLESSLPEESSDKEPAVETAPFGEHFEVLRHTLTPKQLSSETSPFYRAVMQRQWYEQMTTTRPFSREELRLLHTSVIVENKRLHALRARERGENPFTAVERLPDEYFDVNDPMINWASVAQNISSTPPRSADQCRIMYVSTELPSINHSDWSPEEFEKLKQIVETHNHNSTEPVKNIEGDRERLRVDWVEIAQELATNRTALQCLRKFVFEPSPLDASAKGKGQREDAAGSSKSRARDKATGHSWTEEEDKYLLEGIQRHGMGNWPEVALHLNSAMGGKPNYVPRTPNQCSFRYTKSLCPTIKKGKWTKEEDEALRRGVTAFGRTWTKVQEYVQGRTDAQCRERWSNMLDPSLKTGPWDEEEDKILLDAASRKLPWSKIAALLPGRTDSRMLIKREQEQRRESTPPSTKDDVQTRGKKRKATQKPQSIVDESGLESTLVASIDEGTTPNTDTLPAADNIAHDSSPKAKSRPRVRPKPKRRGENEAELPERVRTIETDTQGPGQAKSQFYKTQRGPTGGQGEEVEICREK
ncbi:Myb-like DNA-binding domain containing protein [Ceratobasidium theobromae]|uniref:Myb-like DNA-binding domain containing protein n=1 Tax=Ceratobasidium theobromae TaxID=1582974 RepID=A0A5N5QNS5_9AGAM|nr:Myb-like DNA-binding domain containing protein [Ceratobasidium theobromae]